jgi:hypothetical protein
MIGRLRATVAAVVVALGVTCFAGVSRPIGTTDTGPSAADRSSPRLGSPSALVGGTDPLARLLRGAAPVRWTEAAVARAIHAHAAQRGVSAPGSGMPVAQVRDTPRSGTTYFASAEAEVEGYSFEVTETTRLVGWESVGLIATRDVTLLADAAGRLVVVGDRPLGQADLWDLSPLRAVAVGPALVLGDAADEQLEQMARVGALAVPRVTRFWGTDWARRVVIVAPATLGEFAQEIGDSATAAATFAAVTTGRGVRFGASQVVPFVGSRVYVNPRAWAELSPTGQRIILAHETTHVAAEAVADDSSPLWFNEGVADEVGYAGSGIPERDEAAPILDAVRAGDPPATLPGPAEFHATSLNVVEQAYAGADVAVLLIAHRYGLDRLRKVYRDATLQARTLPGQGADDALAFAFQADLHTSVAAFTRSWLAELRRLARTAG